MRAMLIIRSSNRRPPPPPSNSSPLQIMLIPTLLPKGPFLILVRDFVFNILQFLIRVFSGLLIFVESSRK